ncbi:cupin domain-containing protein [Pyrinomonas sp.]|uniref:cupin domain-containing protein n=1 Tax=Pyrinomonas sp. TaxID=2080306 RepID=UPI00332F067F
MQRIKLNELEQGEEGRLRVAEVLRCGRVRVLLLTLPPGADVPSHRHDGWDVLLQPLRGRAELELDGEKHVLEVGEVACVDGASTFAPRNPGQESLALLVTLVRRD